VLQAEVGRHQPGSLPADVDDHLGGWSLLQAGLHHQKLFYSVVQNNKRGLLYSTRTYVCADVLVRKNLTFYRDTDDVPVTRNYLIMHL
jgi:hypothetical protein